LLDPVVGLSVVGPPLADMLNDISTTLPALKQRYGATAFEWRPFGTTDTVIDLMERLRVDVNAPLQSDYRFHWVPTDLYAEVTRRRTPAEVDQLVDSLGATPSVVIVDQLSLYNPLVYTVFVRLGNYAKKEHAAIISFAPSRTEKTDIVLRSIEGYGGPVLGAYLNPQIPAAGTFARCGVNVQHAQDVKRLIRSSLGLYYVQQKKLQGDAVTKG